MRLFKVVMIAVCMLSFGLAAANAQVLSYTLRNEADAYTAGEKIALGAAISFVQGLAEVDENFEYAIDAKRDKLTANNTTWPIINVAIKINSETLPIEEITFTLALEAAPATKDKYYVVGTVLFPKVNGQENDSLAKIENVMFAETADSFAEVQLVDGKLVIVE